MSVPARATPPGPAEGRGASSPARGLGALAAPEKGAARRAGRPSRRAARAPETEGSALESPTSAAGEAILSKREASGGIGSAIGVALPGAAEVLDSGAARRDAVDSMGVTPGGPTPTTHHDSTPLENFSSRRLDFPDSKITLKLQNDAPRVPAPPDAPNEPRAALPEYINSPLEFFRSDPENQAVLDELPSPPAAQESGPEPTGVEDAPRLSLEQLDQLRNISPNITAADAAQYLAAAPLLEMELADVDDDESSTEPCNAASDPQLPSDEMQLINPTPDTLRAFRSSRRLAMSAILRGEKISQVARTARVSPGTIHSWMKTEAFRSRLKTFDEQMLQRYSRMLSGAAGESVDTLRQIQTTSADDDIRIKAASRIMTSVDRIIDRAKGITELPSGPLIVFPPGTKIAILAQTPSDITASLRRDSGASAIDTEAREFDPGVEQGAEA